MVPLKAVSVVFASLLMASPALAWAPPKDDSASPASGGSAQAVNFAKTVVQDKAASFLSLGKDAPAWMKRIELQGNFPIDGDPSGSILTVQPLYQDENRQDTVFTQLSYLRYSLFDEARNTVNAGLGYRRLLNDNSILLGGNVFFDHEFDNSHHRVGLGVEAKWGPLDFWFNDYIAVSGWKSMGGGVEERALSGRDFRLAGQVPYLPWATLNAMYFHWDKERASYGADGYEVSGEFALTPNVTFEAGHRDDTRNDGTNFIMVRLQLAGDRPALFGSDHPVIAPKAFLSRDLKDQTLVKVRRENRIMLERSTPTGSGITVTISRG